MKNRIIMALPLVSAFALTACMDAYQPTNPPANGHTRATNGAAIGAAIGGIIGLSSDDDKLAKGVVGAAIGGAIGGAIGTHLDQQAADLQQSMGNDNVQITNTGSELIVTLPQDILFATDSSVVVPSLQQDLVALAQNLNAYPNSSVQVIGHTDNTGSADYNQQLSTRRASSVSAILTANGVAPNRVIAFGRGEDQPVATNLTEEGKALNRRVEIVITPTT